MLRSARLAIVVVALGMAAILAVWAGDYEAPQVGLESINKLIDQLGSKQFEVREEATRRLTETDDALPALQKALHSSDPEVRRRSGQIIEAIQARQARKGIERVLMRAKEGGIDLFIDHLIARPDQVDGTTWQAIMELAQNLIAKASKDGQRNIPFPDVEGQGWRTRGCVRKFDELEKARMSDFRALVHRLPERPAVIRSIILSQGPVECSTRLSDSIILANGNLVGSNGDPVWTISNSLVFCDGRIHADIVSDSILIATDSVIVNGTGKKNVVTIEGTREVSKLLKLYDTGQVGVDVEGTKAGVVIRKVVAGSPFAGAGFREGDGVIAINGQKIAATEEFRKSLRRATATGERTAFQVRREDQVIEITVKFEE